MGLGRFCAAKGAALPLFPASRRSSSFVAALSFISAKSSPVLCAAFFSPCPTLFAPPEMMRPAAAAEWSILVFAFSSSPESFRSFSFVPASTPAFLTLWPMDFAVLPVLSPILSSSAAERGDLLRIPCFRSRNAMATPVKESPKPFAAARATAPPICAPLPDEKRPNFAERTSFALCAASASASVP